jgi:HlyD family secretion protein
MDRLKNLLKPVQKPINWFRKTSIRNKIIIVVAILVAGYFAYTRIQSANAAPQYITKAIERASVTQIVSETGNIETAGRVDVYSSSTGIIEEIYIEDGASVKINQNLFKVRSIATDQEKASAYATYQSAVSTQKTAEQNKQSLDATMWTAQKTLLDARETKRVKDNNKNDYEDLEEQSIDAAHVQAEKNFSSAEQQYKEADVEIAAAKAQVSSTWLAYQATQNLIIKAPSSGTVANLSYKVGDKVTANSSGGQAGSTSTTSSTGGSPVLTIANLEEYTVKLALNEVDVPKVKNGQSAELSLDAFPGKKFKGKVTHVDSLGTNTAGVITYNIVIEITNPEDTIRPSMTANVDIEVDKSENVLTVPNSAIKPYEGKKAVQVIDPQTKAAKYIPVEVGIKSPEKTEIKSGVSEGTQVITGSRNGAVEDSSGGLF